MFTQKIKVEIEVTHYTDAENSPNEVGEKGEALETIVGTLFQAKTSFFPGIFVNTLSQNCACLQKGEHSGITRMGRHSRKRVNAPKNRNGKGTLRELERGEMSENGATRSLSKQAHHAVCLT
jgi:hypothetical protein